MKEQDKAATQMAAEMVAMAAAIEKFNRDARAYDVLDELRHTYHIEAIYCTDAVEAVDDKAANFDNLSASDYTKFIKSNE